MQQDNFCETCMRTWKEDEIGSTNHCPECGDRLQGTTKSRLHNHEDESMNTTDLLKKYTIDYRNGKYYWQGKAYTSYREPLTMAQQRDTEKNYAKPVAQETPDIPAKKEEKKKIVIAARTPDEIPADLTKNPLPYDDIHIYDDVAKLKQDILEGNIRKDYVVKLEGDGADAETISWKSIEDAAGDLGIEDIFQSKYDFVSQYSRQWGLYGFYTALVIFTIIVFVRFTSNLPELGIAWILFSGGLILVGKFPKWRIPTYMILFFLPKIFGLKSSVIWMFLGAMFSTLVVSTMYGFPLGMIAGTIVGLRKEKKRVYAPVIEDNSKNIYVKKIIYPLCFLVVAVIAHYFFSLYAIQYLAKA